MSTDTPATGTNKYGFPLVTCTRCHGTGHFSYNQMHGSMCYGCSGTGWQVKGGTAAKAWAAFVADARAYKHPVTRALQVGDEVRTSGNPDHTLRTIASIADAEAIDYISTFSGERVVHQQMTVAFTDGTSMTVSPNTVWDRKGAVDPAPYLATIKGR